MTDAPESPPLIPHWIVEAAERLRAGTLRGEIERGYFADDPNVTPFLEAVADGDELRALATLRGMLIRHPLLIEHPYVLGVFRYLYMSWGPRAKIQTELSKLVKTWAEAVTLGQVQASITKAGRSRRGVSMVLFPALDERDGWIPTTGALDNQADAERFVRIYNDLMQRLEKCVSWRSLPARSRRGHADVVHQIADKVGPAFKQFKRDIGSDAPTVAPDTLLDIARRALKERKGGNPRHKVACGLLAILNWYSPEGRHLHRTPSLVENTIKTLRKRGIGGKEAGRRS